MPIQRCKNKGKRGWRWGKQKCYTGRRAYYYAKRQEKAIRASGYTENAAKQKRVSPLRLDPTRTSTLRRRFESEMARRLNRLRKRVREYVLGELTENYNPGQPRDFQGQWTSGGGGGSSQTPLPKMRPLPEEDDSDFVKENLADEKGIDVGRIDDALVAWQQERAQKLDRKIVSALADRGVVQADAVYRGLHFKTEEEARTYADGIAALGHMKTEDIASFTKDAGQADHFATVPSASRIGSDTTMRSPGVILEVQRGRAKEIRGFETGTGEGEVVLPKGQAYRVRSVAKEEKHGQPVYRVVVEEPTWQERAGVAENYNPNQPRDSRGRWGSGGSGGASFKQTDTPEFKAWFGDSKVVDENGEPLVVYHGTTAEFDEIRGKTWWTSDKEYADQNAGADGQVYSAYLRIENPPPRGKVPETAKEFTDAGYDGIEHEPGVWVPLTADQIRVVDKTEKGLIRNYDPTLNLLPGERWVFRTSADRLTKFTRWLRGALREELGVGDDPSERDWWNAYLRRGYEQGAGAAFDNMRRAGKDMRWYAGTKEEFLRSSFAVPQRMNNLRLLVGRVFTDLKGITEAIATSLTRSLADSFTMGLGPKEMARRLDSEVEGIGRKRALVLSRTETIRAYNEGTLDSLEALGMDEVGVMVEWSTAGFNVCPLCQELEGVVMTIEEAHGLLPRHPQCLPGDSFITSSSGILAASKRWFDGDLVVIKTASGRELACTPNHPVLTDNGWVPAESLDLSSKVVCDGGREWERVINGQDQDVVTSIHDVAESFFRSGEVAAAPVPLTAIDFHGDAADGEVAVVGTDRRLLMQDDTSLFHSRQDRQLDAGDIVTDSLNGLGVEALRRVGYDSAASCLVCGSDLSGSGLGVHAGPLEQFGLALIPRGHTVLDEDLSDDPTPYPEACRRTILGLTSQVRLDDLSQFIPQNRPTDSRVVRVPQNSDDDLVSHSELFGQGSGSSTRAVFLDDVVSVGIRRYVGHVYNLQTESEWYTAQGIITHNCRCSFIPANVGESTKGQLRTKTEIQRAFDASVSQERPKIQKRTLAEQKEMTRWGGPDKRIAKKRPQSILNYNPNQPRDARGRWGSRGGAGSASIPEKSYMPFKLFGDTSHFIDLLRSAPDHIKQKLATSPPIMELHVVEGPLSNDPDLTSKLPKLRTITPPNRETPMASGPEAEVGL